MKQQFEKYTEQDHKVWNILFERQAENLKDKACQAYLDALETMAPVLNSNQVPKFTELNEWFVENTNWEIECVPGLISVDKFFCLLADRKFPSSTWLRRMDQLDYLEEPDMFHDIFGHVPLLSNPVFSAFMVAFGELGKLFLHDEHRLIQLQRLYWFTIEFGLIKESGMKIYGAGIASSFGESNSSLFGDAERIDFDIEIVLNTAFKNDEVQTKYFVIENFDELFLSIETLTEKWTKLETV
ncbi:MAG: phenylalanine 4-monooxygenase [Crocinitomicaceae bacterium]|nr:phenylalanine 4-monooxygenase [Crocinitomicaceae bacterium]